MGARGIAGLIGCALALACGPTGLATRALTADVGRGPLVVLVGGEAPQARAWLDVATPGYRFVHVTGDGERGTLRAAGRRVFIVPADAQPLALQLAEDAAADVAGVLFVADATGLSPAWRRALAAHGWPWHRIATPEARTTARAWWQAWLPPRQAAFSVQPSPAPTVQRSVAPTE